MIDSFAELTLQSEDPVWLGVGERARLGVWARGPKEFGGEGGRHVHFAFSAAPGTLDGPVEHPGGDRSIYVEDAEGDTVEVWDFFHRECGAREGVDAFK